MYLQLCLLTFTTSLYVNCARIGVRAPTFSDKINSEIDEIDEPVLPDCSEPICTGEMEKIYCGGKLIYMTWLFGMHETCPGDMMRNPPEKIHEALNALKFPLKRDQFQAFCKENFVDTPYLKQAELVDWTEEPYNIGRLEDASLRNFTRKLNELWKTLGREFVEQVQQFPSRFPVLPVPNPFIVPGGSFQIYFYWDSYWVIKGLLFSNMTISARHMIENFATVLRYHNYIPNSGSIQLSRRSQPPLFTQMNADYYDATGNKTFLDEMLPLIDQELAWWRKYRIVDVELRAGESYRMFQYKAVTNCPRPENYLMDLKNAYNGTGEHKFVWSSIASACESGIDFSSRWFAYSGKAAETKFSIRTNSLVPVDLNVFMAWNYFTIAHFYDIFGKSRKAAKYRKYYAELRNAIDLVFWSKDDGIWYDYDLEEKGLRERFYPSNVYPLLLGRCASKVGDNIAHYLIKSGALDLKGGVPASLSNKSGEQWDYPDGWPPAIHLFAESLLASGHDKLIKIGEEVAVKFIRTVYNGLMDPSEGMPAACWEKYDVRYDDGRPGNGGEYPVQQGFGWTNGAVLDLIFKFYIQRMDTKTSSLWWQSTDGHVKRFFGSLGLLCVLLLFASSFVLIILRIRMRRNSLKDLQLFEAARLLSDFESSD